MSLGVTQMRISSGVGHNEYTVRTLLGNWNEAQWDPRFEPGRSRLISDTEKQWQSEIARSIGGARGDKITREPTSTWQPPPNPNPHETETTAQFQNPREAPTVIRKFVGGKGIDPNADQRPPTIKAAEYSETWTRSSLKTRERMATESHRSFVPPTKQVTAGLRLFGIPLVDRMREKIWKRGGKAGFRGLGRVLRAIDDNGNKLLDRHDLQHGFQLYGLHFTDQEMEEIMQYFATDLSGTISASHLVNTLRGPMSDKRRDLVTQAYRLLDESGYEQITMQEILNLYDVTKHPDVLTRSKSQKQVLQEFMRGWDKTDDSIVTYDDFLDYYEDISSGIDDDKYFELMIRNAWHISGGEGVAQNTSCRRVLVIHLSGAQTVEEIKNDLRIGPKDMDKMWANLAEQGITDVKRIDLYDR